MAAIVEAVLSREKLISLLDEGHEQPTLDYKETLDLSETRDLVSVTKDVMAMLSNKEGGYILVGVDNNGTPVATLTQKHVAALDESRLRAMVGKYITEPFEIRSAHHVIAGCSIVLIYVAPSPNGFHVVTRNGEYEIIVAATGKMKKEIEFRAGQVFIRRGTASRNASRVGGDARTRAHRPASPATANKRDVMEARRGSLRSTDARVDATQ